MTSWRSWRCWPGSGTGVIPAENLQGFSEDMVIILASALVVSAGVARSGRSRR